MYEKKARQVTFFEDVTLFGGVRLNPENRWVRKSGLIPWAVFEERYAALFSNPREGKPAKSARMAIGKYRPYLTTYLQDGRLEISNKRAERSIKPFVMGRKKLLFANVPRGAEASAIIYSVIETA